VRPGSFGYDLLGYADLYEKDAAIVTVDPKHIVELQGRSSPR